MSNIKNIQRDVKSLKNENFMNALKIIILFTAVYDIKTSRTIKSRTI